jgi:hypothetical protein
VITVHDRPALFLGIGATQSQLVLNRGLPLLVGGVAGIECDAGHGPSFGLVQFLTQHDSAPGRHPRRCVAATLIFGPVVVDCLQVVELLQRDLPADGAGDDQDARIDAGCRRAAVIVRRPRKRT